MGINGRTIADLEMVELDFDPVNIEKCDKHFMVRMTATAQGRACSSAEEDRLAEHLRRSIHEIVYGETLELLHRAQTAAGYSLNAQVLREILADIVELIAYPPQEDE